MVENVHDSFHIITPRLVALSAALKLSDGFTGGALISQPVFVLDGEERKAYKHSASGFWTLTGLAKGAYRLKLQARYYFPKTLVIAVVPGDKVEDPIYRITLQPRPDYPYPPGSMLRGLVTTASKDKLKEGEQVPLGRVKITATYWSIEPNLKKGETLTINTLSDNLGRYNGRYALFLENPNPKKEVSLTFKKADYEEGFAEAEPLVMRNVFLRNQVMAPLT